MTIVDQLYVTIKQLQERVYVQDNLAQHERYERATTLDLILDISGQLIDKLTQLSKCELSRNEMYATTCYIVAAETYRETIEFRHDAVLIITSKGGDA